MYRVAASAPAASLTESVTQSAFAHPDRRRRRRLTRIVHVHGDGGDIGGRRRQDRQAKCQMHDELRMMDEVGGRRSECGGRDNGQRVNTEYCAVERVRTSDEEWSTPAHMPPRLVDMVL